MKLAHIIQRVRILAKMAEEAVRKNDGKMDLVMVDSKDVEALKGATEILNFVENTRKFCAWARTDGEEVNEK